MQTMMSTKESLYGSFPVPTRLFDDFHDTPLTIGVYSLIARLYLVHKEAIALSSGDIQRYDTTLSRGAVLRTLDRLVRGGWLIEYREKRGCKIRYVPAWGFVHGEPRPWQIGSPGLNRPGHVRTLRLRKDLLDVCIGRLAPHQTGAALVTRYSDAPEIGLADVGCYALTLFGKPTPTDSLLRCGLVRDGQALPVPDRLVALKDMQSGKTSDMSTNESVEETKPRNNVAKCNGTTQTLYAKETGKQPTTNAMSMEERRSGGGVDTATPVLSFGILLRPNMIGDMIILVFIYMITWMIGHMGLGTYARYAWERHKRLFLLRAAASTGNPAKQRKQGKVLEPADQVVRLHSGTDIERSWKGKTSEKPIVTYDNHSTEAVLCALRDIGVHPGSSTLLAHMPLDLVQDVIARGRARSDIHDLAAWVVAALRAEHTHRLEHVARVEQPVQPAQPTPAHQAAQHEHENNPDSLAPPTYVTGHDSPPPTRRMRRTERRRARGRVSASERDIDIWAAILSFGPATQEHTQSPTDSTHANIQKECDNAPHLHHVPDSANVPVGDSNDRIPVSRPPALADDVQLSVSQDEIAETATEAEVDMCGGIQAALDARHYYMARYYLNQAVRHNGLPHEVRQSFEQALDHLRHELEQERRTAARLSRQRQRLRNGGMGSLSRVGHVPVGKPSPERFEGAEFEMVQPEHAECNL